jgi:L,D-peptidoglycan transpeptidase YkuD (ErfK/YbiS/YcfS/YnhG family)
MLREFRVTRPSPTAIRFNYAHTMDWQVSPDGTLKLGTRTVRAALGRTGITEASAKREGDGATPLGRYPLRRVLYRADRVECPETALPVRAIRPDDGWCDDPADPAYNRPVRKPYMASHEDLWREDGLYDIILVLGHNDDPPQPGAGSAIFLHCKRGDYEPTQGCIALAPEDVRALLAVAKPGDTLTIG